MTAWICITCGPVELDEIHLLTWDSPHNEETHLGCDGVVEPTPTTTAGLPAGQERE